MQTTHVLRNKTVTIQFPEQNVITIKNKKLDGQLLVFKQWRFDYKAKTSWEVWTFAIPFTSTTYWCYASMQYADSSGKAWGHIYNKTNTGCNMVMDTTTCDYLVIGYQQWGWWDNTKGTLAFTYPIVFPSTHYVITTSGINSGTVDMHISSSPKTTNTGASMATTNSSYWVSCYWMAVGV